MSSTLIVDTGWIGSSVSKLAINRAYRARAVPASKTGMGGKWRAQLYADSEHKTERRLLVRDLAEYAPGERLEGPVSLSIQVRQKRQRRQGPATGLPCMDVDAPLKAIIDSVVAAGWIYDDLQVVALVASKMMTLPGEPAGVRIKLLRMPPEAIDGGLPTDH